MGRSFYVYKNNNGKFPAEFLDHKTGLRICFRMVKQNHLPRPPRLRRSGFITVYQNVRVAELRYM